MSITNWFTNGYGRTHVFGWISLHHGLPFLEWFVAIEYEIVFPCPFHLCTDHQCTSRSLLHGTYSLMIIFSWKQVENMSDEVEYRCFIGGLSWSTSDRGLKDAFKKFGHLVEAKVIHVCIHQCCSLCCNSWYSIQFSANRFFLIFLLFCF